MFLISLKSKKHSNNSLSPMPIYDSNFPGQTMIICVRFALILSNHPMHLSYKLKRLEDPNWFEKNRTLPHIICAWNFSAIRHWICIPFTAYTEHKYSLNILNFTQNLLICGIDIWLVLAFFMCLEMICKDSLPRLDLI